MAERLQCEPDALERLVSALTSLGLVELDGRTASPTPAARRFLSTGSPDYLAHSLKHAHHLVSAWAQLDRSVRTGRPVPERWSLTVDEAEAAAKREAFLLSMHARARRQAPAAAEAWDLGGRRRLLDLAGGPGTYAAAFCARYAGLQAVIFDLPQSRPTALKVVGDLGLTDRIEFVGGDYRTEPLPGLFDAVWISQALHQESPETAAAVVAKAVGALSSGGLLCVQEFALDDDRRGPAAAALFSLNMLLHTEGGRSYTFGEIEKMMVDAGLTDVRRLPAALGPGCALLAGRRP
jgi:hypothetical protein